MLFLCTNVDTWTVCVYAFQCSNIAVTLQVQQVNMLQDFFEKYTGQSICHKMSICKVIWLKIIVVIEYVDMSWTNLLKNESFYICIRTNRVELNGMGKGYVKAILNAIF